MGFSVVSVFKILFNKPTKSVSFDLRPVNASDLS